MPTLRRLYRDEGFALLIISNQKPIGKAVDGKRAATVKAAVDMVVSKAEVRGGALLQHFNASMKC